METTWFDRAAREHADVLAALTWLETRDAAQGRAFVDFFRRDVEQHFDAEERDLYPVLAEVLPADVGSAQAMLREHETIRALVEALDTARGEELVATTRDLALLLREHIRKEEAVIFPLVLRLVRRGA
jgi:hemerythrin-like domain-containing protein